MDISDEKECRKALGVYRATVKNELETLETGTVIGPADLVFDRPTRSMFQGSLCKAMLIGKVDEESGWGFVTGTTGMLEVNDTTLRGSYPHKHFMNGKTELVFRSCAGPVLSQSVHFTTSIVCENFLEVKVATQPFPLTQFPAYTTVLGTLKFSDEFINLHGTGPIANLESIKRMYPKYFPAPAITVPLKMVNAGANWHVHDRFLVTTGVGRVIFGRVVAVDKNGAIVRWMTDEVTLKVFQDLGEGDIIASIRVTRRGTLEIINPGKGYAEDSAFATTDNNVQLKFFVKTKQRRINNISWYNPEFENLRRDEYEQRYSLYECIPVEAPGVKPPVFSEGNTLLLEDKVLCQSDALFMFQAEPMEKATAESKILYHEKDQYLGYLKTRNPPNVVCRWRPEEYGEFELMPRVTIVHPSHGKHIVDDTMDDDTMIDGAVVRAEYEPPLGHGTGGEEHEWTNYLNFKSSGWKR